jgi:hypothetical protein
MMPSSFSSSTTASALPLNSLSSSTAPQVQQTATLQQQAVERAKSAFGTLKGEDVLYAQILLQGDSVSEIVKVLKQKYDCQRKKRRFIVEKFEQYTQWLQNFAGVIDIAVQTQAGIVCPVWAPIRAVLQVHNRTCF